MQTFLPYPDYLRSAQCLDNKRLGKQRVETRQILDTLHTGRKGWANHPATRMWRGYEVALAAYGVAVCITWRARGFKDSLLEGFVSEFEPKLSEFILPDWIGDHKVHASHRSNLLRKLPEHYSQFGWAEEDDLPYFWPV